MNMTLTRTDYLPTGIFGLLDSNDESLELYTLEHAYAVGPDGLQSASLIFKPKIPVGSYACIRGNHKLEGMKETFETFQIMDVPGHSNILFHVGNYNEDSQGCILLGLSRHDNKGILQSRLAFQEFMHVQDGINEFILTVS